MQRLYKTITLSLVMPSVIVAAHLVLDPAQKKDVLQARLAMLKHQLDQKKQEEQILQKRQALLSDANQISAQLTALHDEVIKLGQESTVAENSLKALLAVK